MTQPYPYQLRGVRKIEWFNGRALLADEMGLGKTLQTLLWIQNHPEVRPIIVVCNASLKYQWEREAKMHIGMRAEVIEGTTVPQQRLITPHQLIIINYEILNWRGRKKKKDKDGWLYFLKKLKPKLIVIDECQAIKTRQAQRTKNVRKLCRGVPHVIALSGTPLTNRPAELWPTLNILRPKLYPSFIPYAFEYCNPKLQYGRWVYNGAENLDKLHIELKENVMIRRLKKHVLKELPPKTRIVIPMPIDNPKEYQRALHDFLGWLKTKSKLLEKKARKAMQLSKVSYLLRLAGQLKLNNAIAWIDDFLDESDGKILLFVVHRKIVAQLREHYPNHVHVDGSVTGRDRQHAVDKFQNDKRIRVFIGNIDAAGKGLNLTAASTVAFLELTWTPGQHTQAEDRVHRIKQKEATTAYYLVGRETIEEKLCKIIQDKQHVLDAVLDGKPQDAGGNVFDLLMKELRKEN